MQRVDGADQAVQGIEAAGCGVVQGIGGRCAVAVGVVSEGGGFVVCADLLQHAPEAVEGGGLGFGDGCAGDLLLRDVVVGIERVGNGFVEVVLDRSNAMRGIIRIEQLCTIRQGHGGEVACGIISEAGGGTINRAREQPVPHIIGQARHHAVGVHHGERQAAGVVRRDLRHMAQRIGHGGDIIAGISIGGDRARWVGRRQHVTGAVIYERPSARLPACDRGICLRARDRAAGGIVGKDCRVARRDDLVRLGLEYGIIRDGRGAGLRGACSFRDAGWVAVGIVNVLGDIAVPVGLAGRVAVGIIGERLRPRRNRR